ncbi:hypothetical protein BDF21DRAFT_438380 [Thamnidium elegans]|nr:hypothetical protein BDF21DRAFT_438380 [Thamnidium elegans]
MIVCKLLSSYESTLDELEASGQFSETFFSALTNGQSPSKLNKAKVNTSFLSSQDVKDAAIAAEHAKLLAKEKEESLTKQMQRLQEERRLKEGADIVIEEEPHTTAAHRRRFSFGYITLQVLMAPFRTFWFYIMATMTQSQEHYQRINQHKKRTRQMRLVEPVMEFITMACLVEDRPVLQWAWQMLAMFVWPLIRVFGGGLLIDK